MNSRADRSKILPSGVDMKVEDVCARRLVTIDRAANLEEAAELMRGQHVGTLVVRKYSIRLDCGNGKPRIAG